MRNLIIILKKEFKLIFRNKTILRMMFIMPIMQLILIPMAADYEVKHLKLAIIDQDHSTYSRRLIDKMTASGYFSLEFYQNNYQEALEAVGNNRADIVLSIPNNFEKKLIKEGEATLALAANAVSNTKAGLGSSYATQIVMDFSNDIRSEWILQPKANEIPQISISTANWYNPHIDYHLFMVPGILGILVTMVGSFLASLNIVSEKEIGTIEQINVTPIKKYEFILGKLIPFWVLGMVTTTIGLLVAFIIFRITPSGAYTTIYIFTAVFLLSVLGIGLLISTFTDSQQQATLFAFFFMMVFVLLSGLYTPIESMPEWAKVIAHLNPPMYFVKVIRAIFIKGSTFSDLLQDFWSIVAFAIFFNTWAILNYRKRSA